MADVVAPPPSSGNGVVAALRGIPALYQAVMVEMKKVTWPEFADVRRATVAIIIFVLLLGLVICVIYAIAGRHLLLVRVIPSLFGGR